MVRQPTVSYGWGNANRLTGITQGTTSIPIVYDSANRRSTLTLPNGIVLTYTYDNDSRVTAMTWTLASATVGNLQYQYDADSRVTEKTGSFAQTLLPAAVSGNTFNLANEMTAFKGTPQTYDANGNLTNDGTNTYAWDARNHLVGISGGSSASFAYDADDRRSFKSINGTSTQLLYDGLNPVQEIQSGAVSANMLTGLGIDEYVQRTDSAGARDYLTDILGSSLALTDSTGTIQTQYSYDPFGNSVASGQASSNTYQFTGRENDGTGLNYNRARYYSPGMERFISQDPLEFDGEETNLYSYVGDDPQSLIDSLGTEPNRLGPIGKKDLQDCGFIDRSICRVECRAQGKTLLSCSIEYEWQATGGKGGLARLKYVKLERLCDCGGPPTCHTTQPSLGPLPGGGVVPVLP